MYIKPSPQKGFMKLGVPLFYNWDDAHISTYLLVTEMFDGMECACARSNCCYMYQGQNLVYIFHIWGCYASIVSGFLWNFYP